MSWIPKHVMMNYTADNDLRDSVFTRTISRRTIWRLKWNFSLWSLWVFLFLRFLEDSEWLKYAPVKWLSIISVNVETLTKVWSTGYLLKYTSIQVSKSNSSQKRRKTMSTCLHDYFILNINSVMINGVFKILAREKCCPCRLALVKGRTNIYSHLCSSSNIPHINSELHNWLLINLTKQLHWGCLIIN